MKKFTISNLHCIYLLVKMIKSSPDVQICMGSRNFLGLSCSNIHLTSCGNPLLGIKHFKWFTTDLGKYGCFTSTHPSLAFLTVKEKWVCKRLEEDLESGNENQVTLF